MVNNTVIHDAMIHYDVDDSDELYAILEEQVMNAQCDAIDGCIVEPDGHCSHGKPSWLIALEII